MAREDYQDMIERRTGASHEDWDEALGTAGNMKDIYDTSVGRIIKGFNKGKSTKSIIGMAARNTFDFPVFVSKSIPLDYATATNQLLEQLYAAYVQMAISQDPIVDAKSLKHGGFLSAYQTNVTKYVEYTDTMYQHDACHAEIVTEHGEFTFDMLNCSRSDADVILECMDYEPLSEFDHFFQEGNGLARNHGTKNKRTVTDTEEPILDPNTHLQLRDSNGNLAFRRSHSDSVESTEPEAQNVKNYLDVEDTDAHGRSRRDANGNLIPARNRQEDEYSQYRREVHNRRVKAREDAEKAIKDNEKAGYDTRNARRDADNYARREKDRRAESALKSMTRSAEILKEEDMRKINSMKPLLMKMQMKVMNGDKIAEKAVEFIVGVHTHCRLIDPETLPDVVKYPLKEMNELTRRVKWKAGELKFLRDIVFQVKEKKQTAIDSKDPKKKWYRRLYQLAHEKGDANVAGKISGNQTHGLIPNATIMMTNGDVENIKAQTKLDVLKPSLAKRLCNELFLISLVVIDQDAESIKIFIPDLYGDWEVHSLASVEKQLAELSTAGSKTRDLFKLLK